MTAASTSLSVRSHDHHSVPGLVALSTRAILTFESLNDEGGGALSVFLGDGGNNTLYGPLLGVEFIKHIGGLEVKIHYRRATTQEWRVLAYRLVANGEANTGRICTETALKGGAMPPGHRVREANHRGEKRSYRKGETVEVSYHSTR